MRFVAAFSIKPQKIRFLQSLTILHFSDFSTVFLKKIEFFFTLPDWTFEFFHICIILKKFTGIITGTVPELIGRKKTTLTKKTTKNVRNRKHCQFR